MNAFKQNSSPFFRNSIMKASKISLNITYKSTKIISEKTSIIYFFKFFLLLY